MHSVKIKDYMSNKVITFKPEDSIISALRKLVKQGHDVLYCKNSQEFVKNVDLLMTDLSLQKKLSKNARETWDKNFDPNKSIKGILNKVGC